MKFRQKFAAVLAALMLATSMPTFAASTNGVNKIITVAKGAELDNATAPDLKIKLQDDLEKGETFYLNLENAEWSTQAAINLAKDADLGDFNFTLESKTQLGVTAKEKITAPSKDYKIPMFAKATGGDATVITDDNGTAVTAGKYVFAVATSATSTVTVADAKSFATIGTMADITIEESHTGAFQSATEDKVIRFELEGKDVKFNYATATATGVFVGKKAYSDAKYKYDAKVIDDTTLEVTIPKGSLAGTQRGAFTLTGVELKAVKGAPYGDVNVTVSGDLNDTTEVLVAKYRDYGTDLKAAKEYTATAGQELKNVEFTLSETVADSINGNRETTFTFSDGITIKDVTVSASEGITKDADAPVATPEQKDSKNTNAFTVRSIATDSTVKTSVTMKATLNVPASFTGDIKLVAEGRALEDKKEIEIAKVNAPVSVEVTPATVKVGYTKQEGGKILIKETDKGMLTSGTIILAMDDADFNYKVAPEVKVLEGNLKVDAKAKIVKGGLEITVNGKSTKASTLEISGGELSINGMIPEGTYAVRVGGTAISVHSKATLRDADDKLNNIDEIVKADFIYVGTKNAAAKASFVIGQSTYTVNGVEKTMDTAAYLAKEGRTMLPVRYVSDALGVQPNAILWDSASKTVTVLGDRIVQIKVGSKTMMVNGAIIPMTAAAEMKNDRVFIPVAEIARALGANVTWDETAKTATFN